MDISIGSSGGVQGPQDLPPDGASVRVFTRPLELPEHGGAPVPQADRAMIEEKGVENMKNGLVGGGVTTDAAVILQAQVAQLQAMATATIIRMRG